MGQVVWVETVGSQLASGLFFIWTVSLTLRTPEGVRVRVRVKGGGVCPHTHICTNHYKGYGMLYQRDVRMRRCPGVAKRVPRSHATTHTSWGLTLPLPQGLPFLLVVVVVCVAPVLPAPASVFPYCGDPP